MVATLVCALLLAAPPPSAAADPTSASPPAATLELALAIENSLRTSDPKVLDDAVDLDAIVDRALEGLGATPDFVRGFKYGVRKSNGLALGTLFLSGGLKPGRTQLLRVEVRDGATRALYRVLPEAGVNYFELELAVNEKGRAVVRDSYSYFVGEKVTETVRAGAMKTMTEAKVGFIDRLKGVDRDFLDNHREISEFASLVASGRGKEALALYGRLPASIRRMKALMAGRVAATSKLDPKLYLAAIREFAETYPGDPALELMTIDSYLLRKEFAAAVRAIDRLDAKMDDPYLDALEGGVWKLAGDKARAKASFERAIERDSALLAGYDGLLTLSLADRNHAETTRLLLAIEENTGFVFGNLGGIELYKAYVLSPEYERWMQARGR